MRSHHEMTIGLAEVLLCVAAASVPIKITATKVYARIMRREN